MNQENQDLTTLQQKQQQLAEEYFSLGLTHAQQGRLADSEMAFRGAIALNPNYAEAYGNLGVILKALGDSSLPEIALIFRKSLALQQDNPDILYNLGTVLTQMGSIDEAIRTFKEAIKLKPEYPQAYYNLGLAYRQKELVNEAIASWQRAIKLNPNYVMAYFHLALVYKEKKLLDKAKLCLASVIKLHPNYPDAYNHLGAILTEETNPNLAQVANYFKKAISLNPQYAEAYYNLGVTLTEQESLQDAEKAFRLAIKYDSNYYQAYNNLAALLREKDSLNEGRNACIRAINLKADYYQAYYNLALIYKEKLELAKAEKAIRHTLKLNSDYPKGHFTLAYLLLLRGDFREGWPEYEWRWKSHQLTLPKLTQDRWVGTDLNGKTILLVSEQGLGDTLQFIRYGLVLKAQGATVKLACQEPLIDLLKKQEYLTEVVSIHKPINTLVDVYCPLMSLPLVCGTTLPTIPAPIPYIKCAGQNLVTPPNTSLKVGIVWASGLRSTKTDSYYAYKKKSGSLKLFTQLLTIPGITLYSLQVGVDAQQMNEYSDNPRLVNLSPTIQNFTDTANIIQELDLVISVDTSVAHLAGAMGKPVWLLLPFSPEWRWLLDTNDSPWYPTMSLFRQPQPGDWVGVFDNVTEALRDFTPTP